MGNYLTAFFVGGLFCLVGQLLFDLTKYTPAHILSGFTVVGGILGGLGLYEPLINFAGAGALLPIPVSAMPWLTVLWLRLPEVGCWDACRNVELTSTQHNCCYYIGL